MGRAGVRRGGGSPPIRVATPDACLNSRGGGMELVSCASSGAAGTGCLVSEGRSAVSGATAPTVAASGDAVLNGERGRNAIVVIADLSRRGFGRSGESTGYSGSDWGGSSSGWSFAVVVVGGGTARAWGVGAIVLVFRGCSEIMIHLVTSLVANLFRSVPVTKSLQ